MKNQTSKQKRNAEIINVLKTLDYTKKEKMYAPLIIEVLEATNNLPKKIDNCVVDHNILEQLLYTDNLWFIGDEFGRDDREMGGRFMKACKKLNDTFKAKHPNASDFVVDKRNSEHKRRYFTKEFYSEKYFMRKLISKIVNPLELKRVNQRNYVSISVWDKENKVLWLRWTSGTANGNNFFNDQYELSQPVTEKQIKLMESKIDTFLIENENDWTDEFLMKIYKIIDEIVGE